MKCVKEPLLSKKLRRINFNTKANSYHKKNKRVLILKD